MSGAKAAAQIRRLLQELSHHHGYRTLWLDRRGYLCHSEPDDDYAPIGFTYVVTLMRPSEEELTSVLGAFFSARRQAREIREGIAPLLASA